MRNAEELLEKFRTGKCTEEEKALLEKWLLYYESADASGLSTNDFDIARKEIWAHVQLTVQPVHKRLWPRIAVAAAIAAIVFGLWFYNTSPVIDLNSEIASRNDIVPGRNGATITLANGKVINLSDQKTGVIIGQDLKYDDNTLVIRNVSEGAGSTGMRNDKEDNNVVASTAKGQTYQFTLPDGSKVWLNAGSTLKFPSTFTGINRRKVVLSGEAYFEVFKDKTHPFVVESAGQQVEVLGTHFNVNAYQDELAVKTTLVEGSVLVSPLLSSGAVAKDLSGTRADKGTGSIILKPNQQAILKNNDLKVAPANIESELAWKQGFFKFSDNENIRDIMLDVARWYDVDVEYRGDMSSVNFTGSISRTKNISAILKLMERTGQVNFKIEGRKIIAIK